MLFGRPDRAAGMCAAQVLAELGAANKAPAALEALRAQAEELAGPQAQRLACNVGREAEKLRVRRLSAPCNVTRQVACHV